MTLPQKISLVILLGFIFLFFTQKINLTTADIGRHIKNGEEVFKNSQVLFTNYYSYTDPDFKLINHHWLFGVFSYILWLFGGFRLLSILYILISVCVFLTFFLIAKRFSTFNTAFFAGLIAVPLFASRVEVRPECLSYLFFGLNLYYLLLYWEGSVSFKRLFIILFFLQVVWVNVHIFFIFGIFLSLLFLFNSLLFNKKRVKFYLILSFVLLVASLINPFTIRGFLEPFSIFKEYGYMIVENQSVIFMQGRFLDPLYFYFQISFFLTLILLALISLFTKLRKGLLLFILLFLCFRILSWKLNRIIALYGFLLIPIMSYTLAKINQELKIKYNGTSVVAVFTLFIFFISIISGNLFSPFKGRTGFGLMDRVEASADFFKESNIKGPVFNNYDIGGYLIFNLFPEEKVFVDNRPEAYSVKFFREVYIPMQEDEKVWEKVDEKYKFNAIYFYRHDITPWAQPFLIRRVNDPNWIPVFVDDYTIIFVKNSIENKALIEKYEIQKKVFGQD